MSISANNNKERKKMRIEHVETTSRDKAAKRMPWACAIVKTSNGFRGFESISDYRLYKFLLKKGK